MLLRITHGQLKPGSWAEYEKTYLDAMGADGQVKGLRGRYLARDSDNPDAGYTVSIWDDEASMRAYEEGPLKKIQPRLSPFFSGKYETHCSEIRHDTTGGKNAKTFPEG